MFIFETKLKRHIRTADKLRNVSFFMLLDNYAENWYNILELNKLKREVVGLQPEILSFEEIKEKINSKDIKAVSFGATDCLITYPLWRHSDLFWLLQKDFQAVSSKNLTQFNPLRILAEETARKRSRTGSVNLRQIYKYICDSEKMSQKEADTLLRQECRLAEMYCRTRDFGFSVFTEALNAGKKVFILSDSIVSKRTMHRILESCGYSGWDKIYISSHTRKTKKYGSGFRELLNEQELLENQLLHIGSDPVNDYIAPTNIGIEAVWIPSAKFQMMQTSLYSYIMQMLSIDGIPWESDSILPLRSIMAQTADYLFDIPEKNDVNSVSNEAATGALLAMSDKDDPIVQAALKNVNSRISMHHANALIEHLGNTKKTGSELPLEYMKKYASKEQRESLKNYMNAADYENWCSSIEDTIIEPKKTEIKQDKGLFPAGTKKRAALRYLLKID